jgi:Ran GTPase-activating protein (RanGAP) involved in mRNA processing and transport
VHLAPHVETRLPLVALDDEDAHDLDDRLLERADLLTRVRLEPHGGVTRGGGVLRGFRFLMLDFCKLLTLAHNSCVCCFAMQQDHAMVKKEKIPPPGNKKDEFTNFYSKAKWKQFLLKSTLDCNGRNLRPTGALYVGNALAKNKWVTQLDFSHNHLQDQGAIELAQILKVNDIIQNVNLSNNEITCIGGIALASAFIPYANPTGQPSVWNKSVWTMNLSGNKLKDDSLVALANAAACHRDLTKVDLSYNKITGMGCSSLMRSMQRNNFCNFNLAANNLGDEGVSHVCEAFRRWGGKGSQATLNFFCNDVSKGGAEAIGRLLENNEFVLDVNLAWNTLGFKGTEGLVAKMLPPCKNVVRILNLTNNCLGDEGAETVARLIDADIEHLTRVNVSHNEIKDGGGAALMLAAGRNTHLVALLATHNEFGDKTVELLTELVKTTKTLKTIDIKRSGLKEEHKNTISDSLKHAQSAGFRVDYQTLDELDVMTQFLDKIKDYQEMKAAEEEAKPKAKKGKKKSISK